MIGGPASYLLAGVAWLGIGWVASWLLPPPAAGIAFGIAMGAAALCGVITVIALALGPRDRADG